MLTITLPLKLEKEFIGFCELNNIEDIQKEALNVFNTGFNVTRFGTTPFKNKESTVKPDTKKTKTTKKIEKVKVESVEPVATEPEVPKKTKKVRIIKTDD